MDFYFRLFVGVLLLVILALSILNLIASKTPKDEKRRTRVADTCSPYSGHSFVLPIGKVYAAFFSHHKIGNGNKSELAAILLKNITCVLGWNSFFDYDNIIDVSMEMLKLNVKQSVAVYTIIDKDTFDSSWVVPENETAVSEGVPIYPIYNGTDFTWDELVTYWRSKNVDLLGHYKMTLPYRYVASDTNCIEFMRLFVDQMKENGALKRNSHLNMFNGIVDGINIPLESHSYHLGILCDSGNMYSQNFMDIFFETCTILNYKVCNLLDTEKVKSCRSVLILMTSNLSTGGVLDAIYSDATADKIPIISMYDINLDTFNSMYIKFHDNFPHMFDFQSVQYSKVLNQYALENFFRILSGVLDM